MNTNDTSANGIEWLPEHIWNMPNVSLVVSRPVGTNRVLTIRRTYKDPTAPVIVQMCEEDQAGNLTGDARTADTRTPKQIKDEFGPEVVDYLGLEP